MMLHHFLESPRNQILIPVVRVHHRHTTQGVRAGDAANAYNIFRDSIPSLIAR